MKNSGFLLQCTKPRGQNSQVCVYKRQRIPKGQLKMDNPEKPTTQGTQDEDKQTKQKHNTIYVGHHYAQTNIL